MEEFICHKTIINIDDVKKLWSVRGDKRSYEELQQYEIDEFLDTIIDELIQSKI